MVTLTAAAALYELLARSGYFAPALLPTIPAIVRTLIAMLANGTMIEHAAFTMYRVMFGFGLAITVGIPLGILMARFHRVENFFLPLISALMPIHSFALVPLFMLWFGIGNLTTILIVVLCCDLSDGVQHLGRASARSILCGCARPEPWARDEQKLFWKVIISGCVAFHHHRYAAGLPACVIAVVGAEMIAASDWGLGLGHF